MFIALCLWYSVNCDQHKLKPKQKQVHVSRMATVRGLNCGPKRVQCSSGVSQQRLAQAQADVKSQVVVGGQKY